MAIEKDKPLSFEKKYQAAQSKICNSFLVVIAVLLVPAILASIYRSPDIGWQPVMGLQVLISVIAIFLALFRKKLPYKVRASSIVFLLLVVGFTGVWVFGLVAAGAALLMIVPVLCTVFFNTRIAFVMVVFIFVISGLIGAEIVVDQRLPPFDMENYVTSPSAWLLTVVGRAIGALLLVLTVAYLNEFLIKSLARAQRDAEALKKSEERFALAMRGANDGLWDLDLISGDFYLSPRWYTMFGYEVDSMPGSLETWVSLVDPKDDLKVRQLVDDLTAGVGDNFNTEFRMRHKDGTWVDVMSRAFTVRENGVAVRLVGTNVDITARKQLEAEVRQAQKMEAVGQLTGGVAHDFNNLLAVIMGNAELLDEEIEEKGTIVEKGELVSAIVDAVNRGAELTQRLLAFSRQQPLRPKPVNAGGLIANLKGMLKRTLGETIEIEFHVDSDAWHALADTNQLENALLNLALNGRDAMPEGGKLIFGASNSHIEQADLPQLPGLEPGDYLVLSVSDTGVGMSDQIRAQAFEPFFTTKDVGQGSGLGLSMVYGFARQSGGSVSIYSEEGHGTTVRLYLPRSPGKQPHEQKLRKLEMPTGNKETVLVLEDDVDLLKLVVATLKGLSYCVVQAETAAAAHALLAEGAPVDLILSDVVLPGGTSGPAFVESIRKSQPAMKVLFMSGYSAGAAKGNGLLDGNIELLAKPFSRDELARALQRAFE